MSKPLTNSEPIDMKLANKLIFFISLLSVLVGLTGLLYAAEPICPGGTSPRSDIKLCLGFDNLTNCITGFEIQCKIDNGYTAGSGFKFSSAATSAGGSVVGSGYATSHPPVGGTGSGFQYVEPIPGGKTSAMNLRYYRRFSGGYIDFGGGHGPQLILTGTNCTAALKFQLSLFNLLTYYPSPCGATSFEMFANQPNLPTLRNNRWYLIEMHAVMDTSCTNPSAAHGCNGVYDLYIDEQLVTHYTDVNFGGTTNNMQFQNLWAPLEYYHHGFPPWGSDVAFDNFVYSNNGTHIGPAASENARGTADATSPYFNFTGGNAMTGRRPNGDCDSSGYLGIYTAQPWRNGATLQSTIAHGTYVDNCGPPIPPDKAMKVSTTGGGGGLFLERPANVATRFPQFSNHSWVYLPSTNNQSPTSLAFNGFDRDFWNPVNTYIGISVHNGKWAVEQRNSTGSIQHVDSTTNVTYNAWHEAEIIVWNDGKVTLGIDRSKVLDRATLPGSVSWLFDPAINALNIWGIIDCTGCSTTDLYVDDVGGGSTSWWSCDGWGAASCPFGGGGGGGSIPAAPISLTIK
jgi:hypothetical protein